MKVTLNGVKATYHEVTALATAALVTLNQFSDGLSFLPGSKAAITTAIAVVGFIVTVLKTDEPLIDGLGAPPGDSGQ